MVIHDKVYNTSQFVDEHPYVSYSVSTCPSHPHCLHATLVMQQVHEAYLHLAPPPAPLFQHIG